MNANNPPILRIIFTSHIALIGQAIYKRRDGGLSDAQHMR